VDDLPAGTEHVLDWFHVAKRLTGLGQYARGLTHYNPLEATALQDRFERIKWWWHDNASEAVSHARALAEDVATLASGCPDLARLLKATAGLATCIGDNSAMITDYAEHWVPGEILSSAFAEATVDLVICRHFGEVEACSRRRDTSPGPSAEHPLSVLKQFIEDQGRG
jgi:hypothetical protein